MGVAVFWVLFWVLIITLVVSGFVRNKRRRRTRYEKIKRDFGKADIDIPDDLPHVNATELYDHLKAVHPEDFCIDDTTWSDLDIDEVYKRLDRCVTPAGRDMLWCRLRMLCADRSDAEKMYESIKRCIDDPETSVRTMGILDSLRGGSYPDAGILLSSLKNAKSSGIAPDIASLAGLAVAVTSVAFYPMIGLTATIFMMIVCIATYFSGRRKMEEHLRALAFALRLIRCSHRLCKEGLNAYVDYDDLYSLTRGSFLISFKEKTASDPFSLIFDYVRMISHIDLIAYKVKIGKIARCCGRLMELYADIGRDDTALSLASYLTDRDFCRAFIDDKCHIDAKQIYHPLVKGAVCNDICAQRGIVLTGSNASGKSTFLKAVGLNLLFARSFGFAFAGSFTAGMFDLYTSMALRDDIVGNESYYVVEARSIKRIFDSSSKLTLCIIDEVLRGTNTVERIAASSQILKYMSRHGILCFAATHDLELTNLLKDDMDMYYFTEVISENDVVFPYIINSGSTDRTNAIRLLSVMGFDEEIVSSANELVDRYRTSGKW